MTFSLRHIVAAALLHALLFALLVGGVQCSRPPVKPPVITAVIYNPEKPPAAAKKVDKAAEQEKLKQKVEEQKQKREAEQKRVEEQKRKQAEEKVRLADEKKRKDLEAKKLAEKKAADEKQKAAEDRKRKEAEQKRERDEAVKRDLQRQLEMEEALAREGLEREAQREQDANAASAREAALNAWIVAMRDDISRNWVKPLSAPDEFKCRINVQLLPDGTVTSARILTSCGNAALDKSVQDAVFRASPLPKPADPSVFQRDLNINYEP